MKNTIKAIIAFTLLAMSCLAATILDLKDSSTDVYPNDDTKIELYGETHGTKEYYDIELKLWKENYDSGCYSLFVELPYYSAEFLNIWMKEDSNDLLDTWFKEINGTLSGNEYYYSFFQEIKEICPKTIFFGTDVGHQNSSTGARYLKYLEEHNLKESRNYELAKTCINQGNEYYDTDKQEEEAIELRESCMVINFEDAYKREGNGKIMGIYGSYHTDLCAPRTMASRLKANYGDIISSVKVSSLVASRKNPYEFGFSFTGLLFLFMLIVPNVVWIYRKKKKIHEQEEKQESKALFLYEWIGQVILTSLLLAFPSADPHISIPPNNASFHWVFLIWVMAITMMVFYDCYWIKRFKNISLTNESYSFFAGFPMARITIPLIAIILIGIYSNNLVLVFSPLIFGITNIGIYLLHKNKSILKKKA